MTTLLEESKNFLVAELSRIPDYEYLKSIGYKHAVLSYDWQTLDRREEFKRLKAEGKIRPYGRRLKEEQTAKSWVDSEDVDHRLHQFETEHVNNLSSEQYHAVGRYVTGGLNGGQETGSRSLNSHLVQSALSGQHPQRNFKQHDNEDDDEHPYIRLDHLDSAIHQSSVPFEVTSYTGIEQDPRKLLDSTRTLKSPIYTSASASRSISLLYSGASRFGSKENHIVKIVHPANSKMLYLGNNEDVTPFGQHELILPRGLHLTHMTSKPVTAFGKTVVIHTMHRNPDQEPKLEHYQYKD